MSNSNAHTPGSQYYNSQPSQYSQSNDAHWNGASGAVQLPNDNEGDALNAQSGTNTSGKDAIREGKQKAKETMAAAGMNHGTPNSQDSMANGSAQANGGPRLSRKRTRDGTQLPLADASNGPQPSHNDILLDRYIQRDLLHGVAMNDQAERSREFVKNMEQEKEFILHEIKPRRANNPGSIFATGYSGYGNGSTNTKNQIIYSADRGPAKGRRTMQLCLPRKDNAQQAEQHEELVPIRLDIELDKLRLRDTFTWNLHEKLIPQELFADYLLEDLRIPPENLHEISRQVRQEMQEQIHNFYPHIIVEDGPLDPSRPYSEHKDDEMRIQIKLNITIGRITLIDQFEWDINNPLNSPEEFARQMAWENALSGEFTTAIAHSIREQSQLYTKSLYLTNHCFDGRPVEDPDLRDGFMPAPIHSAFRPPQAQKDWTPYMYEMSEAEFERTETSMMREHRAQKRQLNRRGGPALPDLKDRQRTVRSLILHSVIPGAVDAFEMTGIPKTRRSGRGGRRGGARVDGDVDSEDLESDDSGADSPAPSVVNIGTTARTRGMRGAASAAQAAMRANYGRSVTPDPQMLTPHETRTAPRRSLLRDESAAEDDRLIVKLRIGKAKFRAFWEDYQQKKRASQLPLSGYASQPPPTSNPSATPSRAAHGTPSQASRSLPRQSTTPQPNGHHRAPSSSRVHKDVQYDDQGKTEADHWPHLDEAPVRLAPPPIHTIHPTNNRCSPHRLHG